MEAAYNAAVIERIKEEAKAAIKKHKRIYILNVSQSEYKEYQKYEKAGNRLRVEINGVSVPVRVGPIPQ